MQSDITCNRCSRKIDNKADNIQEIYQQTSQTEDKGHILPSGLFCPFCKICIGFCDEGRWLPTEHYLHKNETINGWHKVESKEDELIHFILSQVIYRQYDAHSDENMEALFDLPGDADVVKLLWINGKAVGFYTLKPTGAEGSRFSSYAMNTVDSVFIRSSHRRQGLGTSMLNDILESFPDEDIGFSSPISVSMLKVLRKFLHLHPGYRRKFWEIQDVGNSGDCKLIWYSLKKKNLE